MAVIDIQHRAITLKIVYYGCAQGGKTTNLVQLQRLTDPDNHHGLVSIATQDDRTLFFDLLPINLGQIGGMAIKVKLYTVPGQVHYELTRRQVLAGADGVVLVVDSSPASKQPNTWATENLRYNLRENGLDPDRMPTVLQWNKRDLTDARPVAELQRELNVRRLPSQESIATTGQGVVETFRAILLKSILFAYERSGRTITEDRLAAVVDEALAGARENQTQQLAAGPSSDSDAATDFDYRFDMEAYRDQQGRYRKIVDQQSLLNEAVNANMKLAERLDDYKTTQQVSERRSVMMQGLSRLANVVSDPALPGLPEGMLADLLAGAGRKRGSLLFIDGDQPSMAPREVVPEGDDPLNLPAEDGLGSVALRMSRIPGVRVIDDLASQVFFDAVPRQARGLASALIAPLACDGLTFGTLIVYSSITETAFDAAETEYWATSAKLIGLSLHWRALRKKLTQAKAG